MVGAAPVPQSAAPQKQKAMADFPVVPPHLSHFMQVPFRTNTRLPHLLFISPS
jgi:hypothetical protein